MEIDSLIARNVFVDSSVVIGKNYRYSHSLFAALSQAISSGRIKLLTTDVTIEEVKAHIDRDIDVATQAVKKCRSSAKILRNISELGESVIFNEIDRASCRKTLHAQFEEFLSVNNAEMVPVSEADIGKVFDRYFKKSTPFGDGKKKSEFPDAFVLSTLSGWAESEQQDVCIISHDSDMNEIEGDYPRLYARNSLAEFLSEVTFYFEQLAPLAQQLLIDNTDSVSEMFEDRFLQLGFLLSDQDGDVNETRVSEVGDISAYLISLTPQLLLRRNRLLEPRKRVLS